MVGPQLLLLGFLQLILLNMVRVTYEHHQLFLVEPLLMGDVFLVPRILMQNLLLDGIVDRLGLGEEVGEKNSQSLHLINFF